MGFEVRNPYQNYPHLLTPLSVCEPLENRDYVSFPKALFCGKIFAYRAV